MKTFGFFLLLILESQISHSQINQVCITVDDLPTVSYSHNQPSFKKELTQDLVSIFTAYKVPAIGYVNESKLYKKDSLDQTEVALLEYWLSKGMELGNHSFSHLNYHRVSLKEYGADILRGEKISKQLLQYYQDTLTYFRHPYLRSGETQERSDSLLQFLQAHGYQEAPVTMDTDDYLFALKYDKALRAGDSSLMRKIVSAYLGHTEKRIAYYEKLSHSLFGRNVPHIFLIHANKLNADCFDEVLDLFERHQYQFISQEQALKDPAYKERVRKFGDWGISWLERWVLSRGEGKELLKEEPPVPEFIR